MNTEVKQAATPESVWAAFMENREQMKETDRRMKETDRMMKEFRAEAEKSRIEAEKRSIEADERMKKLEKTVGGMANNQGKFAEEYFFNSFDNNKQNFFGEKFDEIEKNIKPKTKKLQDEYDIVLYNHHAVAIIEVKYRAHIDDVPSVVKKAETFRILSPDYKDFKIYLGLASMSFPANLEEECIKQGIAIIKQVGDTVVINDKHLKVF